MMKELFLLKLGEIVLKGQNRRVFEDKLKTNTRRRMSKFGQFRVTITQSTLYVEPLNDECDVDGAWEACGAIFGIASMCRCRACEKDLDAIFRTVVEYLGYMIAKRGVEIECIHFFSYPYTSERAKEKVLELARIMTRYCGRMTVDVVGFTKVQEAIRDNCREEYFTIIMRRFMMRIAQAIAKDHGAKCLVTGENLGQVASQTMDAMAVTGAVVDIPMFHPLIGMDKEEIVTRARKIGTLETSILPYEDCCTVFTPKHPKTKPVLALVEAEEAKLDVDALVADALANTEKVAIRYYED